MSSPHVFLLPGSLPEAWPKSVPAEAYLGIVIHAEGVSEQALSELFPQRLTKETVSGDARVVVRAFKPNVTNPVAESLGAVLGVEARLIRIDPMVVASHAPDADLLKRLEWTWREPAIEEIRQLRMQEWLDGNVRPPQAPNRRDDSFDGVEDPGAIDLEFSEEELASLRKEAAAQGRAWTRAEWELFAQTWSEHCKHKIFGARVQAKDVLNETTEGLFKTHIRSPSMEIIGRDAKPRCLSVFVDNAGVLDLRDTQGRSTGWAVALKLETHNSPSAISPYGGASTGIVGVHRDILGTGLGALPIANWDILCFETPDHGGPRPAEALPPDVIRGGVIQGIEDGGNQSGIPTIQGSVVFDPSYAVKPLVYAGTVGLLPDSMIEKRPRPGLILYCAGGATGADGLRGAVMSSRDLRQDDMGGSAVQVACAFVQRRLTDFLMVARDRGLIDSITDDGAGGFGSSCGEMALSTGGARLELGDIRLKALGLNVWEKLLSESQERMTIATSQPEAFEALAKEYRVGFDRIGELTDSGRFEVFDGGRKAVDVRLDFLHEGCPRMNLVADWDESRERAALEASRPAQGRRPDLLDDFAKMLEGVHLCSREGVVRRFDHEVQGRSSTRKPFGGRTQHSPQDGSLIEVPEAGPDVAAVLAHGLAPWRRSIEENVLSSFDEAIASAVLAGADLSSGGLLDNFCWADPIPSAKNPKAGRRLWRLVRACETMSALARDFDLPFISGKDSMKNNSRDFEANETLVISFGGSARLRIRQPSGYFVKANDVVFQLPQLVSSLRDSAWERTFGVRAEGHENPWFKGVSAHERLAELRHWGELLRVRYRALSDLVGEGFIRAAKDVREGGVLTAVFEMCLGRNLGIRFESSDLNLNHWLGEGVGGIVLAVDPHVARNIEEALPGARRLGVVVNVPWIAWGEGARLDLAPLEAAYLRRTREGFWS